MKNQKTKYSLATALFLTGIVGCGSSSSSPSNNPGTGSLTLNVQAAVSSDNFNNNGSGNAVNYSTDLRVDVSKGGAAVTGASVQMSTSLGTFPLPEDPNNPGTYRYTYAGYSGFHTLFVVKGSDNVQGAQLVGPDIHTITVPAQKAVWGLNKTMTTTWQRSMVAQQIEISTRDCANGDQGMPVLADTGSYVLPGPLCFPNATSNQRVRITRTNLLNIGGAVPGSVFQTSVRNTVEPITVQ